jgi:hypothetical protein
VIKPFPIEVVPCGFETTHKARPGEGYNAPGLGILPKGERSVNADFKPVLLGQAGLGDEL